jgi:hypothetical protein
MAISSARPGMSLSHGAMLLDLFWSAAGKYYRKPHDTTVILGIKVPSTDPVFLTVLAFHVVAGLVCVVTGAVAMLSHKRPGRHPRFGTNYYWSLSVVFMTMTVLSIMRWAENYHLFILGMLAFAAASVGRTAHRQRWRDWVRPHLAGMGASYVLLLTAFYVDNGPNLPLWRELPRWAFWVLPATVGAPIIIYVMLRHPIMRRAH